MNNDVIGVIICITILWIGLLAAFYVYFYDIYSKRNTLTFLGKLFYYFFRRTVFLDNIPCT